MGSAISYMLSFLMPTWTNNRETFSDWFCARAQPGLKGDDPRCKELINVGVKRCVSLVEPNYNWGSRIWNFIRRMLYTPPEEMATSVVLKTYFVGNDVQQCKEFLAMERISKQQEFMDCKIKERNKYLTNAGIAAVFIFILAYLFMCAMYAYRKKKIQKKKAYNQKIEEEEDEDEKDEFKDSMFSFDEGDGDQLFGDLDPMYPLDDDNNGRHPPENEKLHQAKDDMPQEGYEEADGQETFEKRFADFGKEQLNATFVKVLDKGSLEVSPKKPACVKFDVSNASRRPKGQKPVPSTKQPAPKLEPVSPFDKASSPNSSYEKEKRTPDAAPSSAPRSTPPSTPRTPRTSRSPKSYAESGAKAKPIKQRTPRPEWQSAAIKAAENFGTPGSFHSKIPIRKKE